MPKIPSVKITDVATAMAPDLQFKMIGVRPGEKIHEVMCPADDSHLTLEFKDHFVIEPSIFFSNRTSERDLKNRIGEMSNYVEKGFEYNSGNNRNFLSIEEIRKVNHSIGFMCKTSHLI